MEMRMDEIKYVAGSEGKPTAVLVYIATWERILDALEDAEDIGLVRETLDTLEAAGGDLSTAGFISWDEARAKFWQPDNSTT
jgi:hypothetical protein